MPSLSQRYRPQRFIDIAGQQAITETLRREVATGRLGHAYLFSGPRGVGKTTAARVFAKALNCASPQDGEPCNRCPPCQAIQAGRCLDVIELDAATHTGVDTVRESIIEHVRFAPTMAKRKVYVLDEVQMFSLASWNALLKTLEEPPAYAFFILATTEWHKVPATILSRCQRFEFKRIEEKDLVARVKFLATQEGWQLADDVAKLVAERADGCVRDAETLLAQLGSLGQSNIDLELAQLIIPSGYAAYALDLMQVWANHDHSAAIQCLERFSAAGVPFLPLIDDLVTLLQRLLRATAYAEQGILIDASGPDDQTVAALAGRFNVGELHDMALMLFERRRDIKAGVDPLFALELASTMIASGLLRHSGSTPQMASPPPSSPATISTQPKVETQMPMAAISDAPPASAPTPADSSVLELSQVRSKWLAMIRAVEEKNHSLPFILKIAQPDRVDGRTVVIRFQYSFHRDKVLGDLKHRRIVEECLRTVMGQPQLTIEGVVQEAAEPVAEPAQDMVGNILKTFGGNVVEQ